MPADSNDTAIEDEPGSMFVTLAEDRAIIDRLGKIAEQEGCSRAALMRRIWREWLREMDDNT